ncbi:MAG: flagellar motor switch protein FliG [Spirochaetaceae bacterium]|jgi:flagellar motor switch protein FliG|nr:flagellar motor switch protein FliG [Spirochaetaceae bacterium]
MGEEHIKDLPGLLKTSGEPEPKIRRVAKFLTIIGIDRAGEIMSRLPPDQVEAISKEIASLAEIGADERRGVLEEFSSLFSVPYNRSGGAEGGAGDYTGVSGGGVEAARRILYAAFGPDKGEHILGKAAPEARPRPFGFLEDFSPEQIALLFKEESPSAAALVFSRLPPKLSARALSNFTGKKKLEILTHIARQRAVSPEILEQVSGALREKARHIAKKEEPDFDGMQALAAILKSSESGFGDQILRELEIEDPELGKLLKDRIYTLADMLEAADLPLQKKLASMDNREIILLLKTMAGSRETAAFREKILSNLSQGRRNEVLEEEEIIGPVPRKDVEMAAEAFLAWFRQGREEGRILMAGDDDLLI